MRRFSPIMLCCVAFVSVAGGVQAATRDPATSEVVGVRLHTTETEARAALRRWLPSNAPSDTDFDAALCADDWIRLLSKRQLGIVSADPKCTSILRATNGNATVSVYLIEDYPTHPRSMRVYAVSYYQDGLTPTHADAIAATAALTKRYGPPDVRVERSMFWGSEAPLASGLGLLKASRALTFGTDESGELTAVPSIDAIDLEALQDDTSLSIFLCDYPYAVTRDAALRNAYAAVVPTTVHFTF